MRKLLISLLTLALGYGSFAPAALAVPLTPWSDGFRPVIQINNDALMTQTGKVKLQIDIENASEMIVANEAGFINVDWQTYKKELDWQMWTENGYNQVYVMFRNAYGTSGTFSDGIFYKTTISTNRRQQIEWKAIEEGRANYDGTPTAKNDGSNTSLTESKDAILPVGIRVGDLLKANGNQTIYYIGMDHLRHAIPSIKEYDSWFQTFLAVKEIPATTLYQLRLGKTMTIRPGTYLVKVKTDPKVYMVDELGRLRWVNSETLIGSLYGHNWKNRIVDLNITQFADYELGPNIQDFKYVDGMIVRNGDFVYKVMNGKMNKLSPDGYIFNDYQDRFTVKFNSVLDLPPAEKEITGWTPDSFPKNTLIKTAIK